MQIKSGLYSCSHPLYIEIYNTPCVTVIRPYWVLCRTGTVRTHILYDRNRIRLAALHRLITLRGLTLRTQRVLKVVVAPRADVEKDHSRLLSFRLILVKDRVLMTAARARDVGVRQSRILTQVCCHASLLFCDVQKVVPIHQAVVYGLVNARAYTTRVDHGASLLLCLGIQEVVALRAKMKRCHLEEVQVRL